MTTTTTDTTLPDLSAVHIRALDTAADGLPLHLCDERARCVCYIRLADVTDEAQAARPDLCPVCRLEWWARHAGRMQAACEGMERLRREVQSDVYDF